MTITFCGQSLAFIISCLCLRKYYDHEYTSKQCLDVCMLEFVKFDSLSYIWKQYLLLFSNLSNACTIFFLWKVQSISFCTPDLWSLFSYLTFKNESTQNLSNARKTTHEGHQVYTLCTLDERFVFDRLISVQSWRPLWTQIFERCQFISTYM